MDDLLFYFGLIFFLLPIGIFLLESIPLAIIDKSKVNKDDYQLIRIKKFKSFLKKNFFIVLGWSFLFTLLATLINHRYGISIRAYGLLLFSWAMLVLAFIDFRYQLLPDVLTLCFIWIGLLFNLYDVTRLVSIHQSVWGSILGYLTLRFFAFLFYRFKRVEGLGRGDMKLMAMIGAWCGLLSLPSIMFTACIFALAFALFMKLFQNQSIERYYSFGPWIILATFFHFY